MIKTIRLWLNDPKACFHFESFQIILRDYEEEFRFVEVWINYFSYEINLVDLLSSIVMKNGFCIIIIGENLQTSWLQKSQTIYWNHNLWIWILSKSINIILVNKKLVHLFMFQQWYY